MTEEQAGKLRTDEQMSSMYRLADEFIALANELCKKHGLDDTSAAIRYAAARYNAFEASQKAGDLATVKQKSLDWFGGEYLKMLDDNLDQHIALKAKEKA